jgi:hypothetical protein
MDSVVAMEDTVVVQTVIVAAMMADVEIRGRTTMMVDVEIIQVVVVSSMAMDSTTATTTAMVDVGKEIVLAIQVLLVKSATRLAIPLTNASRGSTATL